MTASGSLVSAEVRPLRLGWFVLASAALLALRKPWALHTPQFWAEDGEIFMNQDDALGARAILTPYNGYLHLIPRLIAWLASHTADVSWWPAIYNGIAFGLTVAVFARLASSRVELPGKGWLMLAIPLVVGSGEVLINVTNLQWFTAFFLVLHLFTARPATVLQRCGDLVILLLVGLNGPFAILFLPLFACRAWRDRHQDNAMALAAIAFCAAVQGWCFTRGGPDALSLHEGVEPFAPLNFLSIVGSRLVTWPLFGPEAVRAWPGGVHAFLGIALLVPLFAWSLRADPRRPIRATLLAVAALVMLAGAWRVRADTWVEDDLVHGERYFFIPRVLLAWLLILEFDARPFAVALTARALCLLSVIMHLPHFVLPTPTNYRWADHCDPIRRGEPANIHTLPEGWWIEYPGRPEPR